MESIAEKRLGRPVAFHGGSAVLAVRVPLAHQQAIAVEAKEKRWSVSEVVRVAVEAYLAINCKTVPVNSHQQNGIPVEQGGAV